VTDWNTDGEEKYIGPYKNEEEAILDATKKKIKLVYENE